MPQASDFVHLHVHSDHSLLDGAATVESLAGCAQRHAMSHLAITDHGNMFGVARFDRACRAAGVTPIIGCEFYLAPGSRHDRGGDHSRSHHMGLVAADEVGYRNLMALSTIGYTEGFYYRPRIDDEAIAEHAEGLIGFSGCMSGKIPMLLQQDRVDEAADLAGRYRDMFGPGRFYLELQDHGAPPEQKVQNRRLLDLAKRTGLPLVATNDIHYCGRDDADAQDVLICIGTNKRRSDSDRLKQDHSELFFKGPAEMADVFTELPQALAATRAIAEQCALRIPTPGPQMPAYTVPAGHTQETYLVALAEEGLRERYGNPTEEAQERLRHELGVISSMGYAGYFLIVWDFIRFAREHGIPVGPGRGSGAASLVGYCLRITDIDPLRYNLLFERFLNAERVTLPDFDNDFCYERRGEVIDYITRTYGADRVAQVITFGSLKARAVVRDVARVLEIPYGEADTIAKLIPGGPASDLGAALKQEARLQEVRERGDRYRDLIDVSLKLEGLSRHASTHAAAIVIGTSALTDFVPLYRDTRTEAISTQYSHEYLEDCGLVKIDILGLKTLTLIERTLPMVRARGIAIDLETIPEDDEKTFAMLGEGRSACVFQFESAGMRAVLTRVKPTCIEDLIALNALYRPGPMQFIDDFVGGKSGRRPIRHKVRALEPILRETYGVIVYQEQVMEIARAVAGFSLGQADLLRRAMGKKKMAEMEQQRSRFVDGAVANGFDRADAAELFETLVPFAEYGFPKTHAAPYAVVAYRTAYLKANYPAEFMAANLTNEMQDTDKLAEYVSEAHELGLEVLPPSVNRSAADFSVAGGRILFGLRGVKNVGAGAVDSIIAERDRGGEYGDFVDFVSRIDQQAVNRKVIETLIRVGAFDGLGANRATLWENLERMLEAADAERQRTAHGQQDLFAAFQEVREAKPQLAAHDEWERAAMLKDEREHLGMYFTGHPLDDYKDLRPAKGIAELSTLDSRPDGSAAVVIGIVGEVREIATRSGQRMAFAQLEEYGVTAEVVVFPDAFDAGRERLSSGAVVAVRGRVDRSRGSGKVLAEEITSPEALPDRPYRSVHLRLQASEERDLVELRDLCMSRPGACRLFLHYGNGAVGGGGGGGAPDGEASNGPSVPNGEAAAGAAEVVIRAGPQLSVASDGDVMRALEASPLVVEAWAE